MQSTALHLLNDGKSFEEGLIPLFVIIWELCKFVFPAYYSYSNVFWQYFTSKNSSWKPDTCKNNLFKQILSKRKFYKNIL